MLALLQMPRTAAAPDPILPACLPACLPRARAQRLAEEHGLSHFECSAKTGANVEEAFVHLIITLARQRDERGSALEQRGGASASSTAASSRPTEGVLQLDKKGGGAGAAGGQGEDAKQKGGCKC